MKRIFNYLATKGNAIKTATVKLAYRIWGTEIILPEPPKDLPLNSLSPVSDADSDGVFCDTLHWALKKRRERDIRNVAITGPYGSGKSSLLKTFREKHKNDPDLKFLNISLATFKEEKGTNDVKTTGEDLLRLIELSILQQLFYFEKDKAIPDSRFKRIKSFNKANIWTTAIVFTLFVLAICQQIYPCLITKLLLQKCVWPVPGWLHYSSLVIIILFGFLILLKSIRVLRNITLKSFKLNDTAEFEISESINKSILNHHLDEILYFFQVTNYTVVIIEDLDRFEQTEIFTKLRELNLLINNSKKINRDIVFIYAVRDEMFRGEKERTKFFDFIIPIIPVINSSNSGEKLLNIVENSSYRIRKDLIEDVALFIDDMRLLYNIMNEYYLYTRKLGANLDPNKLFAMMVYKNLYPDDFVELSNGSGTLFKFFDEKDKLLSQFLEEKDEQITNIKTEIKKLDQLQIVDVSELRKLYLIQYISQLPGITHFVIDSDNYPLNQIQRIADNDELFDYFIQDDVKYTRLHRQSEYYNYSAQTTNVTLKFEEISKLVDNDSAYHNRLELINDFHDNKAEILRKEISDLERQKIQIKNQPVKVLLQQQSVSIELGDHKQQQLVNILLRNGYIDEHYHDYISIFYEGSLTKEDREFLLKVKARMPSEHTYKLKKIANLINKINPGEFDQSYILNYDLVDHLFKTNTHQTQKKGILSLLSNESESSITFLNGFIDVAVNKGKFIKSLTEYWPNYWKSISKNSVLTQERIRLFLSLMLEHGELKAISAISKQSDLKVYLEAQSDFFGLIDNQKKLYKVVEELDLKFKMLDVEFTGSEEIEFLEQGNYYALNPEMIRLIIKTIGYYDEDIFDRQNYLALQESECDNLQEYINSMINNYITQVYFKLPENTEETEECLQELINHSDLNAKNKVSLLQFTTTKITSLPSITKLEDQTLLFVHSRIEPIWSNLIHYYHNNEDVLNSELIAFLNNAENVFELAVGKIDVSEKAKPSLTTVRKFIFALILENQINDYHYKQFLRLIPGKFDNIPELDTLEHSKMELLIDSKKLKLTKNNYVLIKENFSNLHIKLILISTYEFLKNISLYELIVDEIYQLLKAKEFSMPEKSLIANTIDQTIILSSADLIKICGDYCISNSDFNLPNDTIQGILLHSKTNVAKSIQLFNRKKGIFSKEIALRLVKLLNEPYSQMAIPGKRPMIPESEDNLQFVSSLKEWGLIKDYSKTSKGIRISTYRKK